MSSSSIPSKSTRAYFAAMGKRRAKADIRERFGTAVKFRRDQLGVT